MSEDKLKQGTSLYLAIMVMTILLAIALGLSAIFLGQTKTIKEMGNSVIAFYAADAGIEKILVVRDNPDGQTPDYYSGTLDNGATYQIFVTVGGACPNYCIKSVGSYKETRRAIEITY
jgi:hypothetical protein